MTGITLPRTITTLPVLRATLLPKHFRTLWRRSLCTNTRTRHCNALIVPIRLNLVIKVHVQPITSKLFKCVCSSIIRINFLLSALASWPCACPRRRTVGGDRLACCFFSKNGALHNKMHCDHHYYCLLSRKNWDQVFLQFYC